MSTVVHGRMAGNNIPKSHRRQPNQRTTRVPSNNVWQTPSSPTRTARCLSEWAQPTRPGNKCLPRGTRVQLRFVQSLSHVWRRLWPTSISCRYSSSDKRSPTVSHRSRLRPQLGRPHVRWPRQESKPWPGTIKRRLQREQLWEQLSREFKLETTRIHATKEMFCLQKRRMLVNQTHTRRTSTIYGQKSSTHPRHIQQLPRLPSISRRLRRRRRMDGWRHGWDRATTDEHWYGRSRPISDWIRWDQRCRNHCNPKWSICTACFHQNRRLHCIETQWNRCVLC